MTEDQLPMDPIGEFLAPEPLTPQYWYNDRSGEVEVGPQSPAPYRIGPFDSAAEAARAPEIVAERARAWAAEDEAEDR